MVVILATAKPENALQCGAKTIAPILIKKERNQQITPLIAHKLRTIEEENETD